MGGGRAAGGGGTAGPSTAAIAATAVAAGRGRLLLVHLHLVAPVEVLLLPGSLLAAVAARALAVPDGGSHQLRGAALAARQVQDVVVASGAAGRGRPAPDPVIGRAGPSCAAGLRGGTEVARVGDGTVLSLEGVGRGGRGGTLGVLVLVQLLLDGRLDHHLRREPQLFGWCDSRHHSSTSDHGDSVPDCYCCCGSGFLCSRRRRPLHGVPQLLLPVEDVLDLLDGRHLLLLQLLELPPLCLLLLLPGRRLHHVGPSQRQVHPPREGVAVPYRQLLPRQDGPHRDEVHLLAVLVRHQVLRRVVERRHHVAHPVGAAHVLGVEVVEQRRLSAGPHGRALADVVDAPYVRPVLQALPHRRRVGGADQRAEAGAPGDVVRGPDAHLGLVVPAVLVPPADLHVVGDGDEGALLAVVGRGGAVVDVVHRQGLEVALRELAPVIHLEI